MLGIYFVYFHHPPHAMPVIPFTMKEEVSELTYTRCFPIIPLKKSRESEEESVGGVKGYHLSLPGVWGSEAFFGYFYDVNLKQK